jgi:hypothetical protein
MFYNYNKKSHRKKFPVAGMVMLWLVLTYLAAFFFSLSLNTFSNFSTLGLTTMAQ